MNRAFKAFHLVWLIGVVLVAGCGFSDMDRPDKKQVFSRPPFASVTDSIKRFPDMPELYLHRAGLLSQNNLHELATDDYKKAWELSPNEATSLEYASNMLLTSRDDQAIRFLNECIKKYPANTEFRRRLSEIYAQKGNVSAAINQYDEIIRADSGNFMAWMDKGLLLAKLSDTPGAVASLEKSFAMQPTMYAGLELANLYASSKNAKALALCDALIVRDSVEGVADACYIKGTYLFNVGRYPEALKQFDETIRHDWKFVNAYLDKGIILFEQKNYDEALEVFSKAALVSNTNADAYYWMARCYEATAQKEQAIENYERTLALDRSFTQARERLKNLLK